MAKKNLYMNLQKLVGSRVGDAYREFQMLERLKPQQVQDLSDQRLELILRHAAQKVPYYRMRVPIRRQYALEDFPILTREEIQGNFQELMSDSFRQNYEKGDNFCSYCWTVVRTGGTTGTPTRVIHDRDTRDRGRAARIYNHDLYEFPWGSPHFKLWADYRMINNTKGPLLTRISDRFIGSIMLNAFPLYEADIVRYVEVINRHDRIHNMYAYTDAVYQMAKYIRKNELHVRPLRKIVVTAGTLSEEARTEIQEVFQARVHNQYGSRDCTCVAGECGHRGFHIFSNNVRLETVNSLEVPGGNKLGKILVTLLFNRAFPIIRYDIGDIGSLGSGHCACGRPWPLLERVEGRAVEFILTNTGGHVSPTSISTLVILYSNSEFIRRFQLIQNSLTDFELRLETDPGVPDEVYHNGVARIKSNLVKLLGPRSRISVERVPRLEVTGSGKFLYTINRIKDQPQAGLTFTTTLTGNRS